MSLKIKIGLDPEFMIKYKGDYVYPKLGRANRAFVSLIDSVKNKLGFALQSIDADEFGHCAEVRPKEADNGKDLVLNTIDAMSKLPETFCYYSQNAHRMDKKEFISIVRKLNRKDISESKNIYGKEILDDCPADISARTVGKRLLFCGCHMHISAVNKISITKNGTTLTDNQNVTLPVRTLVSLFDKYLFNSLSDDDCFNIGRYRSPGFYEHKFHGGFEYRSLGASALTPKRLRLIADIMIAITKHVMQPEIIDSMLFHSYNIKTMEHTFSSELHEMVEALAATKATTKNLRDVWVPF